MTVFLTGATGVLGKRVAHLLLENRYKVVALSRSESNSILLRKIGVIPITGDLFNLEEMIAATKGCDVIFHLATHIPKVAIPSKAEHWLENDKIRTLGTSNLLQAANVNNIKSFIQQSVTILFGNQNGAYVNSETPIQDNPVQMVKSAAVMEDMIRSAKDINHIILRFGSFYAKDAYNTQSMIEQLKKSRMPVIGKGHTFMNFIHVDDAARAVIYAFQNFDRLKNRTVNFTDFAPIRSVDFIHGMVKLVNGKKPFSVPTFIAKLLLDKNLYRYLTDSYRVQKETTIVDWQPTYKDFWMGIKEIL